MPIRAVLFDAGATLLYPDPPVEEVYARVFADDGAQFSPERLRDALAETWVEIQRDNRGDRYGGVRGEPAFWRDFLTRVRSLLDGGGISDEAFGSLASHFRRAEAWRVYPDVLPTLERLAESGVALAVVSNWDSYLPRLLELSGLSPFFRTVSVSAIEGTGKPAPEIFRRTCERLAIETGHALHVGDSLREDFDGARGAGLSALLLDRQDRHPGMADRIRSLSEIPEVLIRSAPSAR